MALSDYEDDETYDKNSPVATWLRLLKEQTGVDYYTSQMVADEVGVSLVTVKRWKKTGRCVPVKMFTHKGFRMDLYTREQIESLNGDK